MRAVLADEFLPWYGEGERHFKEWEELRREQLRGSEPPSCTSRGDEGGEGSRDVGRGQVCQGKLEEIRRAGNNGM